MLLRDIDFGNVLGASGVQGFFGEGYWNHHIPFWKPDFTGITFVSKTVTLLSHEGNMPLTRKQTPRALFPRCVRFDPFRRVTLNAVGLSNFGLGYALGTGLWQKRTRPFFISLTCLADTPQRREEELWIMADMIAFCQDQFQAPFGIQLNMSCPNAGKDLASLVDETSELCEILRTGLNVPIIPKFSIASAPVDKVMRLLNDNPHCDAICVSNTVPFGWKEIDQKAVWGSAQSPLAHLGGGGLSGRFLLPHVCEWIADLRDLGFTKPINGGGGIMRPEDADSYHKAGASSIFLGTVASMRPRQVQPIIQRANSLAWR